VLVLWCVVRGGVEVMWWRWCGGTCHCDLCAVVLRIDCGFIVICAAISVSTSLLSVLQIGAACRADIGMPLAFPPIHPVPPCALPLKGAVRLPIWRALQECALMQHPYFLLVGLALGGQGL